MSIDCYLKLDGVTGEATQKTIRVKLNCSPGVGTFKTHPAPLAAVLALAEARQGRLFATNGTTAPRLHWPSTAPAASISPPLR